MATLGLTEGAQVSVFTIMIPILKNEWEVKEEVNTIQVCLVFIGFLLGSVISGQFADRYGRKKPFIVSSFCTAIFTILQAFTTNIVQLIILRFLSALLVGFFGPLGVTLLAEITPLEVRGRFMSLVTVSFAIGQLYGQFVSYFTLENLSHGNWRLLIIFTGLPGLVAWLLGVFFLDESGRYALMDGKYEQAFTIINKINRINGNRMGELTEEQKQQLKESSILMNKQLHQVKGSILSLFQNDGKILTPLIWFNWFTLSFMYYGVLTMMPKMMEEIEKMHPDQEDKNYFSDIVKLAFSTLSEIISACIASYLIEIKGLGRKNSMIICYTLQGISSIIVYIDAGSHFVFWASGCKFFLSMSFIFAYQFTAEIYSTKIRTTGVGMANGIGRSGGGIMPWICMALQKTDIFLPFLLFTCLSFLTALVDFIIPYDTLGRELDTAEQENQEEEKTYQ
ncbi:major facilitator superfamily protein, putative [Ichthyophthirius multifiliis]|uniref:Major facilitator superfamily protein, putative n=1 Tax=Ichthyophthirius multifiliis TaxID=5932 RepID=G0QPZ7_ICHMU|nr:major facilitator superfamily protein, putative [Ichthyophthirius multifiliis]EGR32712.1 major facilitator superfamily protein, putative [Ichthyophthirius multifiliis]|eukprot:XP_004036698.1 major facilitator superfamily protein, putative [Ichthyophthirius multifiliis]